MDSFHALSDPTRRAIIEALARHKVLAASDIAAGFDISKPAISQHLKVLKTAELVTVEVRGQQRLYRLNPAGMDEIEAWLARTRAFWAARLTTLETLLNEEDAQNDPSL